MMQDTRVASPVFAWAFFSCSSSLFLRLLVVLALETVCSSVTIEHWETRDEGSVNVNHKGNWGQWSMIGVPIVPWNDFCFCVVLFFFIYSLSKHLLYHLISQNGGFQETATHGKNKNGLELTVLVMFVCLAERYRRKWWTRLLSYSLLEMSAVHQVRMFKFRKMCVGVYAWEPIELALQQFT